MKITFSAQFLLFLIVLYLILSHVILHKNGISCTISDKRVSIIIENQFKNLIFTESRSFDNGMFLIVCLSDDFKIDMYKAHASQCISFPCVESKTFKAIIIRRKNSQFL